MIELRHGHVVTEKSPKGELHYVEANHRDHNPLVIFLHGFPEHWYSWKNYLVAVAKEGYHTVAVDLRGYNESSSPEGLEAYQMNHLVDDVRALIHHFGNKTTFLVGHDWGGQIAWEVARRSPGLLAGLVVMNAPYFENLKKNLTRELWFSLRQGLRTLEKTFFTEGLERRFLTPHDALVYREALADGKSLIAAMNYSRANKQNWLLLRGKKIEVPTLLIWGKEDVSREKELTLGIAEHFPAGLTRRFYPHTSHWVHLEHPREVQNEILYFMSLNRLRTQALTM